MKLSTWAEFIGLVAVVMSLIFVGIEIRGNTRASQAANQHSLLELAQANGNAILGDAELAEIQAAIDGESEASLTESQRVRAEQLIANSFNVWEAAYYDFQTDQLNPELWTAWNSFHKSRLESSTVRQWWRTNRDGFGPSFASHVDGLVAETGSNNG